jgi:hypothetical protein
MGSSALFGNCGGPGDMAKDCWAKDGSKEGHPQNYRGSSHKGKWNGKNKNSANLYNNNSEDKSQATFMAVHSDKPHFDLGLSRDAWLADSGCLVHIAKKQETFTNSTPLSDETINGLGNNIAEAHGRGTTRLEAQTSGQGKTVLCTTHCMHQQ